MTCFIVIFEVDSARAEAIKAKIKSFTGWAKITSNAWAILSDKKAASLRDEFATLIEEGDRLFVIRSGLEAAWRNPFATNEWLKKYL